MSASATGATTRPPERGPTPHDAPLHAETVDLGMWVFLASEVLFFGVLFVAYAMTRLRFPDAFAAAGHRTSLALGTLNTVVLLTSSLTMALAVQREAVGRRSAAAVLLGVTAALGLLFAGVKTFEYHADYVEHLVPALDFRFDPTYAAGARLFFWLYFALTGVHALHLAIGIALTLLAVRWLRAADARQHGGRIRVVGLYWHFVDVVWIFVFPCLYLVSRA
jgi:cytochrome c oxidase subunit III